MVPLLPSGLSMLLLSLIHRHTTDTTIHLILDLAADPDSFEYSLCSNINAQIWSIWDPIAPAAPLAAARSVFFLSAACPGTIYLAAANSPNDAFANPFVLANSPDDAFASAAVAAITPANLSPSISTNCITHMYTLSDPQFTYADAWWRQHKKL